MVSLASSSAQNSFDDLLLRWRVSSPFVHGKMGLDIRASHTLGTTMGSRIGLTLMVCIFPSSRIGKANHRLVPRGLGGKSARYRSSLLCSQGYAGVVALPIQQYQRIGSVTSRRMPTPGGTAHASDCPCSLTISRYRPLSLAVRFSILISILILNYSLALLHPLLIHTPVPNSQLHTFTSSIKE